MSAWILFKKYFNTCLICFVLFVQLYTATDIKSLETNFEMNLPIYDGIKGFVENEFVYQTIKKACNETQTCANGGSCLKHSCRCLPGTSGELCEIIDDCVKGTLCTLNEETTCEYSVEKQRAFCMCHVMEWRFDDASKTCRDCLCTPWDNQDLKSFNYCEFRQGKQVCTCTEGFSYNPNSQICESCDCGQNSTWCAFNSNGIKECGCPEGYFHYYNRCTKCKCGKNGMCSFHYSPIEYKVCDCDDGYEEYKETCEECSCGKYGKCIFDSDGKQIGCDCIDSYSEKFGKCEKCFCGYETNCSYVGSEKICECKQGFENVAGFCFDINECEKHNPCKKSTRCYNNIGSYTCKCDIGYRRNRLSGECEDINECEIATSCSDPNSECVNTDGSYYCVCSSGYAARGGIDSNTLCEKTETTVLTTFYLIVFACVLVIGFGVIGHQFHLFRKATNDGTIYLVQE